MRLLSSRTTEKLPAPTPWTHAHDSHCDDQCTLPPPSPWDNDRFVLPFRDLRSWALYIHAVLVPGALLLFLRTPPAQS